MFQNCAPNQNTSIKHHNQTLKTFSEKLGRRTHFRMKPLQETS